MFLYHVVYPSHSSNSVESHCVRTRSTMCTVSTMFITQNMRAMIRVISVLCMIAFIAVSFGYAQAQPTQTTQAPSKTKSKTQIESKSQAFDSPQVQSLWSNLHKKLTELGKRYAEHDSLPKNSLIPFKKDQKNNKKKINKITQKLLVELQVSQLDPLLKKRQKIHKNIEKLAGQIMKNKEKMIGAPQKGKLFTKSRQDYQDRITANQKQIQKYQQDLKDNLEAIYQQFLKMGIKINQFKIP